MTATLFVKICGITNLPDAESAIDAGADALGFIFFPRSPRFIDVETARHLFRDLPRGIRKVGVFVDEPREFLEKYIEELALDFVQLCGHETAEYCSGLPTSIIKALRIRDQNDIDNISDYPARFYLLDTFSDKNMGGTGKSFDWQIAVEARKVLHAPIILAGGLNPGNVAEAIKLVRPQGVDVSSGVERSPGVKDHAKIVEFITNARKAGTGSGKDN